MHSNWQKRTKSEHLFLEIALLPPYLCRAKSECRYAMQNGPQPVGCTCNFCKLVLLGRNQTYRRETGEKAKCSLTSFGL